MSLRNWLRSSPKKLLGLDIGSSTIKFAGVKRLGGDSYQLETLGIEVLPPDSIVEGAIISKSLVADTIHHLFKENGVQTKKVATSISGHSVIVKKVILPTQSQAELDESILWEAEQHIPFELSEVNLDYQVMNRNHGGKQMEVILVAAKRDKIADQAAVVSMAGKIPAVVDIEAFALQNAYQVNYQPQPTADAALLNIGSSLTNINVARGVEFLFTRDIAMGGNHYTGFLQKELNIPFEEAENYKRGKAPSQQLKQKTRSVLESVSEILAFEIQKTFDYFKTATPAHIKEIYLSGGASRTEGLKEFLEAKLHLPVHFLNPFRRIPADQNAFPADLLHHLSPDFAIAVGLALRYPGDR